MSDRITTGEFLAWATRLYNTGFNAGIYSTEDNICGEVDKSDMETYNSDFVEEWIEEHPLNLSKGGGPGPKMYILVLDDVPLGHAINCAAHGAVFATLRYQDTPEVKTWLERPARKVTCKVTMAQALKAMEVEEDFVVIREKKLDDKLCAVAFKPRAEYHKHFNFLTLYR